MTVAIFGSDLLVLLALQVFCDLCISPFLVVSVQLREYSGSTTMLAYAQTDQRGIKAVSSTNMVFVAHCC